MRRLENADEEKFWEAFVKDALIFCYRYGKIGSSGHLKIKKFAPRAEAEAIHGKKTTVLRSGSSQRVTGLVVNKPNIEGVPATRVPRDVMRRLKAAIFNREKGKPGKPDETLAQLEGMAAFVHMVDPKRGRAFLDRIIALEGKSA